VVRGVPAALFEGGHRLELYTGSVTVVIFGSNRGQLMRAANALKPVNRMASAGNTLPSPVPGAIEGDVAC
jgi:hypothetical protein